jgi:hypothetical protein
VSPLIDDSSVTGATSNPTIFAKAITGSDHYDDQLREAATAGIRNPQELFFELALADVMIKVPGTAAGLPAIEQLTASGINVNITLLFSVARYEQVIDAFMTGLERRLAAASRSTPSRRSRRSSCRASTPGPTACCRQDRRCADAWPSRTPTARTRALSQPLHDRAPGRIARCWRQPAAAAVGEYRH